MSSTQQIYSVLTVNIWKSYMWTVVVQNELENDLHSNEHYLSSSDKKGWNKFRPVQDLLLCISSAIDHIWCQDIVTARTRTRICSYHMSMHAMIYQFNVKTQGNVESICSIYTVKTRR